MPELPDLEYILAELRTHAVGRRVTGARVVEPIVLRVAVPGDFAALVTGSVLAGLSRHGHFLGFSLGALELLVNPMLAGRFRFSERAAKPEPSLCFALDLEGLELRYLDDKKMGKAYLVRAGDHTRVPGLRELGLDVLAPAFTKDAFRELARKRR